MRGKTVEDVGEAWLSRIPQLLTSLAHVAPEKRPQTRDNWVAYTDFALVLDQLPRSRRHAKWLQELSRIGWITARNKFEAMQAAPSEVHDIGDLLHEITNAIGHELLPLVARRWPWARGEDAQWQAMEKAIETQFFEVSILKQVRTSMRWHQLQLITAPDEDAEQAMQEEMHVPRMDCWPVPLTEPLKLGTLYAHFLSTAAQLQHEGQVMEHCVGTYDYQCFLLGSNIVSLRRSDGRSVSTAELRLVKQGGRFGFEVAQHRGPRNSRPTPEAKDALACLLSYLRIESMQPRLAKMRQELEKRQSVDHMSGRRFVEAILAPHRQRALKEALQLHTGYERFLAAARNAIGGQ